jgi:AhpD family alkylhydroperoxidase
MARVPLLTSDSELAPELQSIFRSVEKMGLDRFGNQFGALAHHPPLAEAIHGLMRTYYTQSVVENKYLELAILLVSRLNQCNYCVVHHTPSVVNYGFNAEQLQAIEDGSWSQDGLFDSIERAVLQFAEQMNTRKGRIDDSLFAELSRTFNRAQIVELTVRIAMCEFFNRFNEALQLDIEPVAEALYDQAMDG